MTRLNRRDVLAGVAAMAAGGVAAAQSIGVATDKAAGDFAGGAKVFEVDGMARVTMPNRTEKIAAFGGTLPTGELVSMHETWLPVGMEPIPLHVIRHNEIVAILEGEVEFHHGDVVTRARVGDVIYVAYGTSHAIRNVGTVTARYMVFQVGGDTK